MVALQCSMDRNRKAVRNRKQDKAENNDTNALTESPQSLKFSSVDSSENFIRRYLRKREPAQYTSCWNRPFFFSSPIKATAASVDLAPNWATISTSARSTSLAMR